MKRQLSASVLVALVTSVSLVTGQTKITAPGNKYTPAQDVQLGREAAQEVQQKLPILRDNNVDNYVERIGERLVQHIPAEFHHSEFRYTFDVINLREINAFALPGGPMYAHRGMIEKASSEAEVAGVLAHEISHVALRHGTAQATKATKYQVGQVGAAILGAIIGGRTGEAVSGIGQFGIGAAFLRYSRDYEKQADLLGAQIMARAGYDPRAMASMFRTIEREAGARGPEWLSNHPNPGNRSEYITREAEALRVENAINNTTEFRDVQSRLRSMSPAPTAEEVARSGGNRYPTSTGTNGTMRPSGRVAPPSTRYQTYNEGNIFQVAVPSNWREMANENQVTFAPEGGYGAINNQSVFTHGVQIGLARNETHDLRQATDELLSALAQSNRGMRRPSGYSRVNLGGRSGLRTVVLNESDNTGLERLAIYTTQLSDGSLFYLIGVAPENEYGAYDDVFARVAGSIRFAR